MEVKIYNVGPIKTNCYLVSTENEMLVIDPGGEGDFLISEILKKNKKLKYIVNTHFHFDHILADLDLKQRFNSEILIHEFEKEFINFKADRYLRDGDKIKLDNESLEVVLTPGHSLGSICLLGDDLIFTGDTLFKGTWGRTDLPGGSEEEIQKSLNKIDKLIKPGMMIYPGHGELFRFEQNS